MRRKRKMKAAEKQRRRERREARRGKRLARRTPAEQERRDLVRAARVDFGQRALEALRRRAQRVHRERTA